MPLKTKLNHVDKYYLDGHPDAPPTALAKSLGASIRTVKAYLSSKITKEAARLAREKFESYVDNVPKEPAQDKLLQNLKGPVPQGRDGITVMTEAAAMHGDKVASTITTGANEEWMAAHRNCIAKC